VLGVRIVDAEPLHFWREFVRDSVKPTCGTRQTASSAAVKIALISFVLWHRDSLLTIDSSPLGAVATAFKLDRSPSTVVNRCAISSRFFAVPNSS
jgi:hypothetical protein